MTLKYPTYVEGLAACLAAEQDYKDRMGAFADQMAGEVRG